MSIKIKKIFIICIICTLTIVVAAMLFYPSLGGKVIAMNRISGGGFELYRLNYARNGLVVAYNPMYTVVLQQQNEKWVLTHLLNPLPAQHFSFQGSTVSGVAIDSSENYIAIYSRGIDNIKDPLYIFDLTESKFYEYEHGAFPDNLIFDFPDNSIKPLLHNTIPTQIKGNHRYDRESNSVIFYDNDENPIREVNLKYRPESAIYLYDESTIVYMYAAFGLDRVGDYRICFQNIETGHVERIRIK